MSQSVAPRGLDAGRLQHLKATIEADIAAGRYHGAGIVVARDGKIGLHEAAGRVRSTSHNAVRKDSVFSLLSVTKAFTNVLVLRAIERGQLSLFTKVSSVIPEFSGLPRNEITVEHLLTHRSGLPSVYSPRPGMYLDRLDEIIAAICSSLYCVDEPGTRVNYSPMAGHALLGELLRRTDPSRRSYRQIVKDDLFTPLGMKDSAIGVRADLKSRHIPPELPPEFPATHPGSSNLGTHGAFEEENSEMPWVGGFTTVGDLHRFTEMLRRGGELDGERILSPRMIDVATRNFTGDLPNLMFAARGLTRGWKPSPAYIGLGFQLRGEAMSRHIFGTLTSPRTFGNQGAGSTLYWVDPDLGMTFVCLTVPVLDDGNNIERFQRLSDIAVSAAT
jgi:CubicO group peptidase (beta-lactamase class C family)